MENSNQENNIQDQKEFLDNLRKMVEKAPKGLKFLIFADGDYEKDKQMVLIGAKGKPADISFMVAAGISKDPEIEKIIGAANAASNLIPSYILDILINGK